MHPCPHICQQNGKTERKHMHIVEMGLVLLSQAGMPLKYWWEAFVYLINRLSTHVLDQETPFEVLFGHKPNYAFLKTFGCACYPFLRLYNKHKTNFHSKVSLFRL